MIVIFEKSDLSDEGRKRCFGVAPVTPEMTDMYAQSQRAAKWAETIYVTRHDDTVVMVKGRNARINEAPATIQVVRSLTS